MTKGSPKYIVDTCSFTTLRRVYPREMFSPVWTLLSDLAREGAMAGIPGVAAVLHGAVHMADGGECSALLSLEAVGSWRL
jgi:hypothetical protein